ncbi:hypothetical protein EDB19DRAFT_1910308 [Suillus lakei]|nr:hypothetical protein EDB19DRAFT_1910308 [Suillus lakei]
MSIKSTLSISRLAMSCPRNCLNDLPALQVLRVDKNNMGGPSGGGYHILPSLPIFRLSTLRTLEFIGMFSFTSGLLPDLNPVLVHLSDLTLDECEQHLVLRSLQLAPNLSSFRIRVLFSDGHRLEPLTHTSV